MRGSRWLESVSHKTHAADIFSSNFIEEAQIACGLAVRRSANMPRIGTHTHVGVFGVERAVNATPPILAYPVYVHIRRAAHYQAMVMSQTVNYFTEAILEDDD